MASDPADPATLTLIGAVVAALTGAGGLILSARKNSGDAMSLIVQDALAVSDRNREDAHDCRAMLDEFAARIDELAAAVQACEDKHRAAEVEIAALRRDLAP